MIFIHNFAPKYTAKLIELGIAKEGDGFKISQHYATPEEMRFNNIAKEDGELFNIVKELGSCFYIDRLQGGTFYSEYSYDEELLKKYAEISDFLGFQLHELGTTRVLDWNRITRQLKAFGYEKTEENIIEAVRAVSANKEVLHFSQGRASEYAALETPKTLTEAFEDIKGVILKAKKRTADRVFTCDAGTSLAAIDTKIGQKLAFIEVGCQTKFSRVQYAIRRGASKAIGGLWGAYLEPWSHMSNGTTCYCFMRDGSNEWFIGGEGFAYNHDGERGGSSMSYAKRMMYYSLFSGADYFSEEWGQSNTFYDFCDFELSPYGKIKKEFCDFSQGFKSVKPYTPIAIVIPREYGVFNTHTRVFPYEDLIDDTQSKRRMETAERIVSFTYNEKNLGTEDVYFTNGILPSIFDIIFEDSYTKIPDSYSLVIDLTNKLEKSSKVIDGWSDDAFCKIDEFTRQHLPIRVTSSDRLDYMIFEESSRNFVAVFNHAGVSKSVEEGERVNPKAHINAEIKVRSGKFTGAYNLCGSDYSIKEDTAIIGLDGGEFILLEYN